MKTSAFLLLLATTGHAVAQKTVYVVRHAEKDRSDPSDRDPDLTAAGHARARQLATMLRSVPIRTIYTTRYRRTKGTVAPIAKRLGITPRVPGTGATRDFVKALQDGHEGEHVLVAGHSNTVPDLLAGLGIRRRIGIADSDYDNLFVVHVGKDGRATLSWLHYGERSGPRTSYMGRTIARTMHWTGAGWLMRETREKEEQPEKMLNALAIQKGMTVCDFGCGNGYHALRLAKRVGPKGRVYAVDVQKQMLTLLASRQKKAGVTNIEHILASESDPKLPDGSCDLILCVDVYHELSYPVKILAALRRALKPDGRLVLVEFRAEDPDVPIKPLHKMSKAQVEKELGANGFRLAGSFDELPWQHVLTFEKQ